MLSASGTTSAQRTSGAKPTSSGDTTGQLLWTYGAPQFLFDEPSECAVPSKTKTQARPPRSRVIISRESVENTVPRKPHSAFTLGSRLGNETEVEIQSSSERRALCCRARGLFILSKNLLGHENWQQARFSIAADNFNKSTDRKSLRLPRFLAIRISVSQYQGDLPLQIRYRCSEQCVASHFKAAGP